MTSNKATHILLSWIKDSNAFNFVMSKVPVKS